MLQKFFETEFPLFDHVAENNGREGRVKWNQRKPWFPRAYRSRSFGVQSFNSHHLHSVFCLSNSQSKHSTNYQFKRHECDYDNFERKVNTNYNRYNYNKYTYLVIVNSNIVGIIHDSTSENKLQYYFSMVAGTDWFTKYMLAITS